MKRMKMILCVLLAVVFVIPAAACDNNLGGVETSNDIKILTTAVVGTVTTANDPYKKYIKDKYGLNATLIAATDFSTTSQMLFSNYDDMPDIVAFSNIDSFRQIFNQGVLLSDWGPYLKDMPNFTKIINTEDDDRPGQKSIARLMLTEDDKLTALWTLPDPPAWSLKIREDWADEYRAVTVAGGLADNSITYPAGATATNGAPWRPETPNDLLNFARWIRCTKNADQNALTCFGFSTAGEKKDFGVLGTWLPLMYGSVCQLPWGISFNSDGEVQFGITDGTHKQMLDFISIIIKEKLIEPNWYYNSPAQKTSVAGKIGIEWYTGELSESTQSYFNRNEIKDGSGEIVDTSDWWKTYPVPKDPSSVNGGYQPSDGFLGTILTVSAKAANDSAKMTKIIKFLDDLAMTKSVDEDRKTVYNRSAAYDALRWGVGIESTLEFQPIDDTGLSYLYTGDEGVSERSYRSQYPGAWDWGTFFRSTDDGVVQGTSSMTVTKVTRKVVEHDAITASYHRRLQYGSVLKLDTSQVSSLTRNIQTFEYTYVNKNYASAADATAAYDTFKSGWLSAGGQAVLQAAGAQFKKLGFI